MKKFNLKKMIKEEVGAFMNRIDQESFIGEEENERKNPDITIAPWEKVVPSGTEKPAILVDPQKQPIIQDPVQLVITDPNKICKLIAIAKMAANHSPIMDTFEGKKIQLYKPRKGIKAKFSMHIKDGKGRIKEVHFGKKNRISEDSNFNAATDVDTTSVKAKIATNFANSHAGSPEDRQAWKEIIEKLLSDYEKELYSTKVHEASFMQEPSKSTDAQKTGQDVNNFTQIKNG